MPELPEVETIRQGLSNRLANRTITNVEVRTAKIFSGDPQKILNTAITDISRQGKLLIFQLTGNLYLTVHLKMTGQLIWKPADEDESDTVAGGHPEKVYLEPLPHKHTHVIFTFDDGSHLYFNDLRKFGLIEVLTESELNNLNFLQKLGPEPLEPGFTAEYLREQLKSHPGQPIKSFLLDQSNIAGLGNIYADESLFCAAIRPDRLAKSLTEGEIRNLHDCVQEVIELAIQRGGSTARDYVNAVGERGTFLDIANVYRRTGLDCNRCLEGKITRKVVGGRSSHFCPVCQR